MFIRIDNLHMNRGKHAVTENRLTFEINYRIVGSFSKNKSNIAYIRANC